jgi:hypothetical protein
MKNHRKTISLGGILVTIFCFLIISNNLALQTALGIEDFQVLQTGIISTEKNDYAISNNFETRILQDGKIMRISGITTTGEAYYVYQKIDGDVTIVQGKILVNGVFVPIINKDIILEQEVLPETKLTMVVKLPKYTYSGYPFVISVKVFDAEKNPQGIFDDDFGTLENVFVNVTITNRSDKFVTALSGNTDSSGLFRGTYLVNEGIVGLGEFNVNVNVDDGHASINNSFTTFFRGDIRNYFDDDT